MKNLLELNIFYKRFLSHNFTIFIYFFILIKFIYIKTKNYLKFMKIFSKLLIKSLSKRINYLQKCRSIVSTLLIIFSQSVITCKKLVLYLLIVSLLVWLRICKKLKGNSLIIKNFTKESNKQHLTLKLYNLDLQRLYLIRKSHVTNLSHTIFTHFLL